MANISHFTQTINGVSTTYDIHDANAVPRSGGAVMTGALSRSVNDDEFSLNGGTSSSNGASVNLRGKDKSTNAGTVSIVANDGTESAEMLLHANGNLIWANNIVISANLIRRTDYSWYNAFLGGNEMMAGGRVLAYGYKHPSYGGWVRLLPTLSPSSFKEMNIHPDGGWTWNGTACQITSDQRYKQQIAEIDDKLLDAWEDVNLVQFKYNDAVDQKGKSARLHTGYVVQQIDNACKSHGVDVSQYGLYCHEEYPQETEEVEVEQADGTKTKETKVIREASEHYSLRYTEALIVECKYLRRCIARLTARIEQLEKEREASK